jgi:predicted oxidoreductase
MDELLEKIHPEGPELSKISVGMLRLPEWDYSKKELAEYIESVVDLGVTTIDHADIYGEYMSQPLFGEMLAENPGLRDKIQLTSKCGNVLVSENKPDHKVNHYNLTQEHIRNSVETTLRDLHTDYIDLLMLHRPSPLMVIDEVAEILTKLVDEGKVLHLGVSNFTPEQFDWLQSQLDYPLVTNQVQASLLHTEPLFNGLFDYFQRYEIRPMIWSPLKGGELFKGDKDQTVRVRIALIKLAEKYECTFDVIALAWLLQLPVNPFPVVGTGKLLHIKKAVKATQLDIERQDWFELLEASLGEPVP